MLEDGRWARNWDHCQKCNTTERPHQAHGLCNQCYLRQYWKENSEELAERAHQRYVEHRVERSEYQYQYRQEHYTAILKRSRQYYQEHREERRKSSYQWAKNNPEKHREQGRRRYARKKGAAIEPVDGQKIFERYNHTCIYCGRKEDLTLDHVVPLNGGGPHCEDNLVVACQSCNSSKKDKRLMDWLRLRPGLQAWVM